MFHDYRLGQRAVTRNEESHNQATDYPAFSKSSSKCGSSSSSGKNAEGQRQWNFLTYYDLHIICLEYSCTGIATNTLQRNLGFPTTCQAIQFHGECWQEPAKYKNTWLWNPMQCKQNSEQQRKSNIADQNQSSQPARHERNLERPLKIELVPLFICLHFKGVQPHLCFRVIRCSWYVLVLFPPGQP